ncbi:MAG: hypothetical protein AABW71_04485 [Nanoarchaeota archaeon]
MNNYSKMTLFTLLFVFLFASTGLASASHPYNTYTYTDRNVFSYNEDDNGFKVGFDEKRHVSRGYTYCGYYDWSYGGKRCARSWGDRQYYPDHASYEYDHDVVVKEAFKTYQQRSKQEYQLEVRRIGLEERRRYGYGGYGYGYSDHRYYSYGW